MECIYNKNEFENRANNLYWTISENYNEDISILEKDYISNNTTMYSVILYGAMQKYIEWEEVKRYLFNTIKKGYDFKTILNLVQIVLNPKTEEELIRERPGVIDIRNLAYKEILNNFSKISKEDVLRKIRYTLILESMDKHPAVDGFNRRLINSIKSVDINQPILKILENIDKIYASYFKTLDNKESYDTKEFIKEDKDHNIDFDTFSDFMYEDLYNEENNILVENEIKKVQSHMISEDIKLSDLDIHENPSDRVIVVDEKTLEKIHNRMENYYGKSYLSRDEIKRVETKNCKNLHEGCRVHFTDGVLRSECSNIVQIKYVTRQKENNISKFRDNVKIHKRNIIKLKDSISRILIEENEISRVYSGCGNICANRVWKISRSNNKKIFFKDVENEKGKYVIDILLDGSGSQRRNQSDIATQAYTISMALTMAGIANRVMSFSSFMDYTILKRFRNYDENLDSCENIFEYFCAGNNRDGLAIKSICDGLLKRSEENKILIVLSDGKPNDVKFGKDRERSIRGETSYRGRVGVKDTANEIRKARQEGILVLGVFTGNERELEDQRMIYGRDFIYTKDIERFSNIVSAYLKKIISN